MSRLLQLIRPPQNLFYLVSAIILIVNVFLIVNELFWLAWMLPVLLILVIFFVFSLDNVLFFIVLSTPLALNLEDVFPKLSLSFPTEPLLAALLLVFIIKLIIGQVPERRVFSHPIVIAVMLYLGWMLITSFTSQYPIVSFKYFIARLWFVVPMLFMITPLFKDLRKVHVFYWLYMVSFCVVIIYTTYNHAGYGFSEKGANWAMSPFFNDHTAYGVMLAFFIPILTGLCMTKIYTSGMRIVSFIMLIVFIIALILSYLSLIHISEPTRRTP